MKSIRTCTGFGISSISNPIAHGVIRFTLSPSTLSNGTELQSTIKLLDIPPMSQVTIKDAWVVVHTGFEGGTRLFVGDSFGADSILRDVDISGLTGAKDVGGSTIVGWHKDQKGQHLDSFSTGIANGTLTITVTAGGTLAVASQSVGSCELFLSFVEVYDEANESASTGPSHAYHDDTPLDGGLVNPAPFLGPSVINTGTQDLDETFSLIYTGPDKPVPEDVGGIRYGSNFSASGTPGPVSITTLLDTLLYPYQEPTFSAFTLDSPPSSIVEVGQSLQATAVFQWSFTNAENVEPNTVGISDSVEGSLASGISNTPTFTHNYATAPVSNTPGARTWTISADNTEGVTFSRSFTVNWGLQVFTFTASAETLSASTDFSALPYALKTQSSVYSGSYSFPEASGEYKYFVVPADWSGGGVTWEDALTSLNVGVQNGGSIDITNQHGITTTYNIFRSTNKLGAAMDIIIKQG